MIRRFLFACSAAIALAGAVTGCNSHSSFALPAAPSSATNADIETGDVVDPRFGKIQHVVVIVQENRTVDNLFNGFPHASTYPYGWGHGVKYDLHDVSMAANFDLNHSHLQFLVDYDGGKVNGWDHQLYKFRTNCKNPYNNPTCWEYLPKNYYARAFGRVPRSESVPYWTMAERYAFADHTFASNDGPSYPSHQFLIAGQAAHVTDNPTYQPWGCDSGEGTIIYVLKYGTTHPVHFPASTGLEVPSGFPCFHYSTVAESLDRRAISWRYYAPSPGQNVGAQWSAFDAIWQIRYSRDWYRNVISPETRIFNDILQSKLARVTWVVPSLVNSDHAGSLSKTGPDWVGSIVNAIGKSPYWKDTAIVVVWDDWGGWYDHEIPPQVPSHDGVNEGMGFRVPLIVISPYAKRHYVSHNLHEIASTLHFIENTFGLPTLGEADKRADALEDMFDLSQPPTPFQQIPTRYDAKYFQAQKPSYYPPDD